MSGAPSQADTSSTSDAQAPTSEEATLKARLLEHEIEDRFRRVQRETEMLQLLHKQVQNMEGPQRHSIEQLRQEIVRVSSEIERWSTEKAKAKESLTQATQALRERQDVKRRLSERLFKLLLDSEDTREERLHSVERKLEAFSTSDRALHAPGQADASKSHSETIASDDASQTESKVVSDGAP